MVIFLFCFRSFVVVLISHKFFPIFCLPFFFVCVCLSKQFFVLFFFLSNLIFWMGIIIIFFFCLAQHRKKSERFLFCCCCFFGWTRQKKSPSVLIQEGGLIFFNDLNLGSFVVVLFLFQHGKKKLPALWSKRGVLFLEKRFKLGGQFLSPRRGTTISFFFLFRERKDSSHRLTSFSRCLFGRSPFPKKKGAFGGRGMFFWDKIINFCSFVIKNILGRLWDQTDLLITYRPISGRFWP